MVAMMKLTLAPLISNISPLFLPHKYDRGISPRYAIVSPVAGDIGTL